MVKDLFKPLWTVVKTGYLVPPRAYEVAQAPIPNTLFLLAVGLVGLAPVRQTVAAEVLCVYV